VPLDYGRIIASLTQQRVEFIIIGGVAAVAQGVPLATLDIDLLYRQTKENCHRLAAALRPFHPTLRGAPKDLPFKCDGPTLLAGCNFTFATDEGDIDVLGHVSGIGNYEAAARSAEKMALYGHEVLVMSLPDLIKAKKAAGRTKDKLHLLHLEATLRLRQQMKPKD
jgi:predicted nucleotidyltransferase